MLYVNCISINLKGNGTSPCLFLKQCRWSLLTYLVYPPCNTRVTIPSSNTHHVKNKNTVKFRILIFKVSDRLKSPSQFFKGKNQVTQNKNCAYISTWYSFHTKYYWLILHSDSLMIPFWMVTSTSEQRLKGK